MMECRAVCAVDIATGYDAPAIVIIQFSAPKVLPIPITGFCECDNSTHTHTYMSITTIVVIAATAPAPVVVVDVKNACARM